VICVLFRTRSSKSAFNTLKDIHMTRFAVSLLALVCCCLVAAPRAQAQYVTYYAPAVAATPVYSTYYAPAVAAAPVTYAVASPVTYTVASPVTVAAAPAACCAPAAVPVTTFYRAPQVVYQPTPTVVTRYRPILGGTVSRVRTTWMPVVY
jgi:hypothetical protein